MYSVFQLTKKRGREKSLSIWFPSGKGDIETKSEKSNYSLVDIIKLCMRHSSLVTQLIKVTNVSLKP